MYTCHIRALTLSVLLLVAHPSSAIDMENNFLTRGIGAKVGSCGDYTTTDITTKRWYEHWLLGYISGVNQYRLGKAD